MRRSYALLILVTACGGSPASDSGGSGASDGDGTESTSGSSSTAMEPSCGNGIVEVDEECDDENVASGDACDPDCRVPAQQLWSFDRHENPLEPYAIAVDAQGMPYVAGKRQTNAETSVPWIAKFDNDGTLLWEYTDEPGPRASTYATALWVRDDGSVVAATSFGGYGGIRQLDSSGSEILRHGCEGVPWALVVTATDVFVAGERWNPDAPDDYDAVLARYDATGEQVWAQAYPGAAAKNDGFRTLAVGTDGMLVAGGWADGVPDEDPFSLRLSKHTQGGTLVWEVIDDGGGLERQIRGVALDADMIFATGWSTDAADARGILVAGYDTNGAQLWEQIVREHEDSQGNAIVVTEDGALAVAGFAAVNEYDGWLGRFDADGLALSSLTVDGVVHGADFATDAFVGSDGTLVVGYGVDNEADAAYVDYDLRVTAYSR